MVELIVLLTILAAQIYAIVRSEILLSRERKLHAKIEEFLDRLTPAGLWPQYEHLKKFYEEQAVSLRQRDEDLEQRQAEIQALTDQNAALSDENSSAAKVLEQMAEQMGGLRDSIRFQLNDARTQIDSLTEIQASGAVVIPSVRIRGAGTVDPTYMVQAERQKAAEASEESEG